MYLFSGFAFSGQTEKNPLVVAVEKRECNTVKELLESNVDANTEFVEYKMKERVPVLLMSLSRGDSCISKLLISHGANVNYIIKKSKQINKKNAAILPGLASGKTPLSITAVNAVNFDFVSMDLVELLLKQGAKKDLIDSDGNNILQYQLSVLEKQIKGSKKKERKLDNINKLLEKY